MKNCITTTEPLCTTLFYPESTIFLKYNGGADFKPMV